VAAAIPAAQPALFRLGNKRLAQVLYLAVSSPKAPFRGILGHPGAQNGNNGRFCSNVEAFHAATTPVKLRSGKLPQGRGGEGDSATGPERAIQLVWISFI